MEFRYQESKDNLGIKKSAFWIDLSQAITDVNAPLAAYVV